MTDNPFGGKWTGEKLEAVEKYLKAYITIFKANTKAKHFETIYVDAFAGSGVIYQPKKNIESEYLLPEISKKETQEFIKGSVKRALEIPKKFNKYLFIDKEKANTNILYKLKDDYPKISGKIEIVNQDANIYLKKWCSETNWKKNRSLIFIDPYGMQVEWELLRAIAETKAIDLWLLFPLGTVNRLLTKNELPSKSWEDTLTKLFGTDEWKTEFYKDQDQQTLFKGVEEQSQVKDTDFKKITDYFVKRLKTIFPGVAKNPLLMRNSKNVPIFLLFFVVSNPEAVEVGLKIAQNILGSK